MTDETPEEAPEGRKPDKKPARKSRAKPKSKAKSKPKAKANPAKQPAAPKPPRKRAAKKNTKDVILPPDQIQEDDDDTSEKLPPAKLPECLDIKKIGRPTKYDPMYCEAVEELGAQGKSKVQIACRIGVTRETIDVWARTHTEFADSLKRARELAQAWWEDMGQENCARKGFNATAFIFQVKNRFRDDYRDVHKPDKDEQPAGLQDGKPEPKPLHDDHLGDLSSRYDKGLRAIQGGKS